MDLSIFASATRVSLTLTFLDSIACLLATLQIFHTALARLHILEAALENGLVARFHSVPLFATFYWCISRPGGISSVSHVDPGIHEIN